MKYKELRQLKSNLLNVAKHRGISFALCITHNLFKIDEKIKLFSELMDKEYPEFEDFRNEAIKLEGEEYDEYINNNQDIIDKRKQIEKEYLEKDCELQFELIEEKDLPKDLNAEEILSISTIIKLKA